MRWWLNTDHKRFSVDNAVVSGLDFSALDPDIWMVQWIDGKGEIERQDTGTDENLNGLREPFVDVTPYAPLFQQFLTLCPLLTLPQAKKVQIDLINAIFDGKRQLPFHYPVAAGDYWWDASDATMGASTSAALQNTTAKLNEVISRLNALVNALLNAQLIAEINANVVSEANANVVAGVNAAITAYNSGTVAKGNSLVADINANIVTPTNQALDDHNTYTVGTGNSLIDYLKNVVLGVFGGGNASNTINDKLRTTSFSGPGILAAAPGLAGDISWYGSAFSHVNTRCNAMTEGFSGATGISGVSGVNGLPWTNIANVTTSNQQWIPIGSTVPVNVTPAEQAAIMSGIAARTNNLNLKRNTKIAEVNALTTIPAVIAYDVTAGWPVIPLPPTIFLTYQEVPQ